LKEKTRSVELLFPLLLTGLYILSAVTVLLLTAGVYSGGRTRSQAQYESFTALSYLTERVRRNDREEGLCLGKIGEQDAIIFTIHTETGSYDTYLYCYEGHLRELMVKKELTPEPNMGRKLLPLASFTPEMSADGLLLLRCTATDGVEAVQYVALRSQGG